MTTSCSRGMERRGALLRPRRRLCGDPGRLRHAPHPTDQALRRGPPGYDVAGYWYADDPTTINNCAPCRGREIQAIDNDLQVITVTPGQPLPPSGGIGGLVTDGNLPLHRIAVKRLPTTNPFPFEVIQPLLGATAATCPPL